MANPIVIDDLRALVTGWRRAPVNELVIRCRALAMAAQRRAVPDEIVREWVQMSAVVTVLPQPGGVVSKD